MAYSKRIDILCSLLTAADVFADVGCDHGYCSEYMLQTGLCKKAILSDISKGSLAKAERLLADYIDVGRAVSVLGNGFYGVPKNVDEVLIAGMGGSEIVAILSDETYGFIPKRFVFQPMHDAEKLRRYLIEKGALLERDFTFSDVKYYDVIVGVNATEKAKQGGQVRDYSPAEYEFGRENLEKMPIAFTEKLQKLIKNTKAYLSNPNLQEDNKNELMKKQKRLEGVLNGEIK